MFEARWVDRREERCESISTDQEKVSTFGKSINKSANLALARIMCDCHKPPFVSATAKKDTLPGKYKRSIGSADSLTRVRLLRRRTRS